MESSLKDRVALVTGSFTGIGFAICQALASRGANLALCARNVDEKKAQDIRATGCQVLSKAVDIKQTSQIDQFIKDINAELGSVDILVNCAGISAHQLVQNHPDELWNDVIETNLNAPFKLIRSCLPQMKDKKWGRIINIGSTAARVARAESAAYCASKSGLLGLTRAVALEGAAHGISCVMVSPTWVETPMMHRSMSVAAQQNNTTTDQEFADLIKQTPQKRLVQAQEIAALVSFLCSDEALGITMEDIQLNAANEW